MARFIERALQLAALLFIIAGITGIILGARHAYLSAA